MNVVRIGMIGGGHGALIGPVHRQAARLDNLFELKAGAFSRSAEINARTGSALGLDDQRVYASVDQMLAGERALPFDQRIQAVAIVTPNAVHTEQVIACLDAGFHVMVDKPIATRTDDIAKIEKARRRSGKVLAVSLTYLGYPAVCEARRLVQSGEIGKVRKIYVRYLQGWLAKDLESTGNAQASWRTDPQQAGAAGALGDIGTHAQAIVEFVTGQSINDLRTSLHTFVDGRRLDDDVDVLFALPSGARGNLSASQVCVGEANGLELNIYGCSGSIAWRQEAPDQLIKHDEDGRRFTERVGVNTMEGAKGSAAPRLPGGHPEGFIEAFANLYRGFFNEITGEVHPDDPTAPSLLRPIAYRSVAFMEACIKSAANGTSVEPKFHFDDYGA